MLSIHFDDDHEWWVSGRVFEITPGNVSATLTDVAPDPGFGTNGHRKKIAGGAFDVADATLVDGPRRRLGFIGEEINAKFESTAIARRSRTGKQFRTNDDTGRR